MVEERLRRTNTRTKKTHASLELQLSQIAKDIKTCLVTIEDAIPLISLAITTSGASLTTQLPSTVSPSRLLQASTCLTQGDLKYANDPTGSVQIGPTFTLSLYMLFAGHHMRIDDEARGIRKTTWQEVLHKAQVRLVRVPGVPSARINDHSKKDYVYDDIPATSQENVYSYRLEMIEDLDDNRVHDFEDSAKKPSPYRDVALAGIREGFPVHQISRIFYADTGKILNIGSDLGANNPVLLLKRDVNAIPPRRMMHPTERDLSLYREPIDDGDEDVPPLLEEDDQNDIDQQLRLESTDSADERGNSADQLWQFPPTLDQEWLAFEVYMETEDDDDDDEPEMSRSVTSCLNNATAPSSLPTNENHALVEATTSSLDALKISQKEDLEAHGPGNGRHTLHNGQSLAGIGATNLPGGTRSSLSLLEVLIRLTILQQFQQENHLSIHDELLTFFLQEASTTGMDGDQRRRMRRDARVKVGFDPYDESPVKRHGEEYQYQAQEQQETYSEYSQAATPYGDYHIQNSKWSRGESHTPDGTPEPWPLRSQALRPSSSIRPRSTSRRQLFEADIGSSPIVTRKAARPFGPTLYGGTRASESRLEREMSLEIDSSLGTSPERPDSRGKDEHRDYN